MIDINNTLDLVKLKFYNEWLYTAHIYEEGDSQMHSYLTASIVTTYIDPLALPKDAKILDLGCGPGYFLDEMKKRGYTDLTGVSLSPGDIKICENKGHTIKKYDMSFLPQKEGYYDESVDFIFLRQALEHSPYPIFSLMEYNRILKQGSKIYIEVPTPNNIRKHEWNPNHYSVLGEQQLGALIDRCGFVTDKFDNFKFELKVPVDDKIPIDTADDSTFTNVEEEFYCIVATKNRPLDIK